MTEAQQPAAPQPITARLGDWTADWEPGVPLITIRRDVRGQRVQVPIDAGLRPTAEELRAILVKITSDPDPDELPTWWRARAQLANQAAVFYPAEPDPDDPEHQIHPAIGVGGLMVWVYLDPKTRRYVISADFDTVPDWMTDPSNQGATYLQVDYNGVPQDTSDRTTGADTT